MLGLSRRHHRRATEERERGRGRHANRPSEIPAKGWRDILLRVKSEISEDNLGMIAAGVAFYFLLAIFPGIAAAVSIFGLIADPGQIQREIEALAGVLPQQAVDLLTGQLSQITQQGGSALSLGLAISLAGTLWAASQGIKALMTALNIVYDEEERRGLIRYNVIALILTLGAIIYVLLALTLVVAIPVVIGWLGLSPTLEWVLLLVRWPVLALLVVLGLALLYRFAPAREPPRWRWLSWGSAAATLLWLLGSIAFSIYVSNFTNYNETYGSVGAVVILLLWFNLTSYAVLLGAELDAEMEHQTMRDTTTGKAEPLGRRGAYVADTVGQKPR